MTFTVTAHLEGVLAADEGDVVREFESPLDAIDSGVWFPAEIGKPGILTAIRSPPGSCEKPEVQTAASDLHAEFIEGRIAGEGIVLKGKVQVT